MNVDSYLRQIIQTFAAKVGPSQRHLLSAAQKFVGKLTELTSVNIPIPDVCVTPKADAVVFRWGQYPQHYMDVMVRQSATGTLTEIQRSDSSRSYVFPDFMNVDPEILNTGITKFGTRSPERLRPRKPSVFKPKKVKVIHRYVIPGFTWKRVKTIPAAQPWAVCDYTMSCVLRQPPLHTIKDFSAKASRGSTTVRDLQGVDTVYVEFEGMTNFVMDIAPIRKYRYKPFRGSHVVTSEHFVSVGQILRYASKAIKGYYQKQGLRGVSGTFTSISKVSDSPGALVVRIRPNMF